MSEKTTANPWRETVRDIYDRLHFQDPGLFSGDPLAKELIAFIEERHHDYFCEGKTPEEWERERHG